MEKILDQYIKQLITTYPAIVKVLSEFRIGCTTCSSGTCRLSDIIKIHRLSADDEYKLFKNIAGIVYPGQDIKIPSLPRKNNGKKDQNKFSPPLQMLIDEHTLIKKVIASIHLLIDNVKEDFEQGKSGLYQVLNFFSYYADKFHHAKEEDCLFKLFYENSDIVSTMYEEHKSGRLYVSKAKSALDIGDLQTLSSNLTSYAALLIEHIRKEDEILYPWMDNALTDKQIGILYSKFMEIASRNGEESKIVNTISQIIGR